ncbi:MAG: hypothetical protein C0392_05885 [Syntrophus sp. (in: bacteria)]|nr:hypothetical protein [Syntrophus sp. (in: bacteria)]
MSKLFYAVIAGLFLFSSTAFAQGLKVTDSKGEYVTKFVTAENIKGVEVRLSKELIRNDCNSRTMSLTHVLVSGDGDGWHDKYFFDAHMTQTKMHCPLDKPVNETIYSKPVFIKSFANENVNNKVVVSFVIPNGFKLEVVAVK